MSNRIRDVGARGTYDTCPRNAKEQQELPFANISHVSRGRGARLKSDVHLANESSSLDPAQRDGLVTVASGNSDEKSKESLSPAPIAIEDARLEEKPFGHASDDINLAEALSPELGPPPSDAGSMAAEYVYPEGGLQAWLVVLGSWCALFASLGIANTLASFQAYISQDHLSSYSPSQIGWIFSLYVFLTFVCGVYIGPIFDVYGPRWLVLPGSVCVVLSMFLVGICEEYWHFILVFSIIGGVGTSLLFTPSFAAIGHFFNRGRGNATGIAATGCAFGGIAFPLLLQSLIPKVGFAWATRVMGLVVLFLCIIGNLLIKSNLPHSLAAKSPHPDFRILSQPAFAMTVLGCFLIEWALFIPLTYIASYALQQGFDQAFAYQILPILNAGSVLGRWLPGYYSDTLGRFNCVLACIFLTIITVFVIWLPFGGHTAGIVVFVVLFGFASGSNISLTPVCVGQLCETRDYGRYYATCYTIVSLGCLTGVPIAGEMIQRCGGEYWGLIIFTGCCYVGAFGAFAVARGRMKGLVC